MKLIETNACLGHWAARRLRYNTPAGLLQLMDRAGIAQAWVSSASAIMYRNCHAGNEELHETLMGSGVRAPDLPGRLVPFAVISPAYAGWERDLRWCVEVMGARGLRLYPAYHRYRLGDACCHELVRAAAELNLVVSVPQRVEDYRQRHWLIDAPDVDLNELAALARAHPGTRFLLSNAQGVTGSDFVARRADMPDNTWADICRPDVLYSKEAIALIEGLGRDRIVFGAGIPFTYPEPATVRMEVLQAQGYDVEAIGSGNAERLLG
jgi:predicted TIM-barrel fold metal-dependent hydrolase